MENKKEMNIILAVVVCLILIGGVIFISVNNKANMITTNKIKQNDIIYDCYDRFSDLQLLHVYGFVEKNEDEFLPHILLVSWNRKIENVIKVVSKRSHY